MLNYCIVKQRIGAITEDTPDDDDRYPDYTSVFGQVVFAPTMANGSAYKITDNTGVVHTVPATRINAQIVNGEITHEGLPGLPLFAAGPNANPSTIVYTATYSNLTAAGRPVDLNSITFRAVPGETIDLSSYTPVAGAPTPGIVQGPPGHTPFIGGNGNWWINGEDTGVAATSPIVHSYAELTEAFEENTLRVSALEAMNGVTPESPVDGQTANLIAQSGTLTNAIISGLLEGVDRVVSPSVSRIIASTDPDTPLDEGDLLLVYKPPASIVEDFTEGMESWSVMGHPHTWVHEVIDGDGMVTITPEAIGTRGYLTSDVVGEVGDVEVVAKMTASLLTSRVGTGVGIRLSGAQGSENGYMAFLMQEDVGNAPYINLVRYNDGVYTEISKIPLTFEVNANSFVWVRMRNESGRLYVKSWADGDYEPSEWQKNTSGQSISAPGRVGLTPGSRTSKNFYTYFAAAEIENGDETAQVVTS